VARTRQEAQFRPDHSAGIVFAPPPREAIADRHTFLAPCEGPAFSGARQRHFPFAEGTPRQCSGDAFRRKKNRGAFGVSKGPVSARLRAGSRVFRTRPPRRSAIPCAGPTCFRVVGRRKRAPAAGGKHPGRGTRDPPPTRARGGGACACAVGRSRTPLIGSIRGRGSAARRGGPRAGGKFRPAGWIFRRRFCTSASSGRFGAPRRIPRRTTPGPVQQSRGKGGGGFDGGRRASVISAAAKGGPQQNVCLRIRGNRREGGGGDMETSHNVEPLPPAGRSSNQNGSSALFARTAIEEEIACFAAARCFPHGTGRGGGGRGAGA